MDSDPRVWFAGGHEAGRISYQTLDAIRLEPMSFVRRRGLTLMAFAQLRFAFNEYNIKLKIINIPDLAAWLLLPGMFNYQNYKVEIARESTLYFS